jgi:alpha-amylase/alpha-mannosidase (GH57 family)
MQLWETTHDGVARPRRVVSGRRVTVHAGTWPIAPGQSVWVDVHAEHADGTAADTRVTAEWVFNLDVDSHWRAELGPFPDGARVWYALGGRDEGGELACAPAEFRVGPALHVALLWHQHQPVYRTTLAPAPGGLTLPWVRLHALRDYYGMAALAAEHPAVHVTINLTPVLLDQLEDYTECRGTDRALELTLRPAEHLAPEEREELLGAFFDADWHRQIFVHPRYRELFEARRAGAPFAVQDLRDLQMWFSLAWFASEFRAGDVRLVTGETVSVRSFVEQDRGYAHDDITAMVEEQYKVLRAVVPLHRQLQQEGRIEVTTTPWAHPILPLLLDTGPAAVDRPGTWLPRRFAHPEDATLHVRRAVEQYERLFGARPRGLWPAEGAVCADMIPLLARHGIRWMATDAGVLARSGHWGYRVDDPDVLCQPRRAANAGAELSVLFRDPWLSDRIGFHYQQVADPEAAARDFTAQLESRVAARLRDPTDRLVTIVLDGENAWGGYADDGRPFLRALYRALGESDHLRCVTPSEYLEGNVARGIASHPVAAQEAVHDLATGSWIDECGSAPGVDLGTWIGEQEENRAWELLGAVRDDLAQAGATASSAPRSFDALTAAEGSDWFWWFGDDQDSGCDERFDELFRMHLSNVHRALGAAPDAALSVPLVARHVTWSFTAPVARIGPRDRISIVTNCEGELAWTLDESELRRSALQLSGGVMAGARRHYVTLGPFGDAARELCFRFRCGCGGCSGQDACCRGETEQRVRIAAG